MRFKYGPYSPSRLEVANCGYAFYMQYVNPETKVLARARSSASDRGSATHEVLEQITRRLLTEGECSFSAEEVRAWVSEAVNRHPGAYSEVEDILEMARLYIKKPPPFPLTKEAKTELDIAIRYVGKDPNGQYLFEQCDYESPEALARGWADILDISDDAERAVIIDHKTQPNIEEADTFQMGFYAWVMKRTYPFLKEISTVLHFVRYGNYSKPYVWTDEHIDHIEDGVLARIESIETRQEWEATPHKGCQYCPFVMQCPVVKEHLEAQEDGSWRVKPVSLKILGQTGKAVQLAGLVNILDSLRTRINDELKDFVKAAEAPIAIPGRIYGYHQSAPKVDWDRVNKSLREKTYDIFEKHGVDPRKFMGFSQSFSTAVWQLGNQQLLDELSTLFPTKVETKFEGKKV